MYKAHSHRCDNEAVAIVCDGMKFGYVSTVDDEEYLSRWIF
jgi:hypothetical protein